MYRIKYKLCALALFALTIGIAQESFTGSFFVHAENTGGGLALFNNKVFGDNEIISTERLNKGDACVVFAENSSWENKYGSGYIDGFVMSKKESFVFPVGGNGKFMPVKASHAKDLKIAYITNDSSFDLANDDTGIQLLHTSEYWVVQGDKATNLSFAWENGVTQNLSTTDVSQLRILGFKNSEWQVLPSAVDDKVFDMSSSSGGLLDELSTFKRGVISTSSLLVPNDYLAFTIGVVSDAMNDVVGNNDKKARSLDLANYTKVKSIHFPFQEFNVTRYSTNLLAKLSKTLIDENVRVKLIGHTDAFGSLNYNHSLGEKRAESIKKMLEGYGVNFIEVEIISKGKEEAKYDCEQLDCNSRETIEDRRVDIYILNE